MYTLGLQQGTSSKYSFLDPDIVSVFKEQPGQDITKSLNSCHGWQGLEFCGSESRLHEERILSWRVSRCQVQNDMLLAFTIIVVTSMVLKCESTRFLSSAF